MRVWASLTEEKSVASPSLWKKQSTTLLPPSAGRLIGRHSRPNCSRISSSVASGFASRASILLITMSRQSPRSRAASMKRCVMDSTPVTALTTIAAVSMASSIGSARPMKSGNPGVSTRLTSAPPVSSQQTVASTEWSRRRAWGSWSQTVVPRARLPLARTLPAPNSSASASRVLPAPACPTRAKLRMSPVALAILSPGPAALPAGFSNRITLTAAAGLRHPGWTGKLGWPKDQGPETGAGRGTHGDFGQGRQRRSDGRAERDSARRHHARAPHHLHHHDSRDDARGQDRPAPRQPEPADRAAAGRQALRRVRRHDLLERRAGRPADLPRLRRDRERQGPAARDPRGRAPARALRVRRERAVHAAARRPAEGRLRLRRRRAGRSARTRALGNSPRAGPAPPTARRPVPRRLALRGRRRMRRRYRWPPSLRAPEPGHARDDRARRLGRRGRAA